MTGLSEIKCPACGESQHNAACLYVVAATDRSWNGLPHHLIADDVTRELRLTDYRAVVSRAMVLVGIDRRDSVGDLLYEIDEAYRRHGVRP